jgi:hypothetical protein
MMGRATRKTQNEHNFVMKINQIAKIAGVEISELWWELKKNKQG